MNRPFYSQNAGLKPGRTFHNQDSSLDLESNILRLSEIVLRAGLFQEPGIRRALEAFALTGDPSIYESVLRRCYATGFYRSQLKSRGFETPLSHDHVQGQIPIGRIIDTDFTYGLNIDDVTRHVFCAGSPGQGKTYFLHNLLLPVVRAGIKVVFVDPKGGDFHGFVPEGVLYIPWHELWFNILRPPENVELRRWIPRLAEALGESLGLLLASSGLLQDLLERTCEKWMGKLYPCFHELAAEVRSQDRRFGKAAMYIDTVQNRMTTVEHTLSEVLYCRRGFMDELMQQSFILDISSLTGTGQNILCECLTTYIYEWHKANVPRERDQKLVRVVCIDEAQHNVLAVNKGKTARIAAAGMEQAIALGRELGLGFIGAAQSPSKVLHEMLNDAHCRVCFGLGSGEEIWKMAQSLGLTREQAKIIPHLSVGQAIVRKPSGYTFPALVQCFQANLRQSSDADWRRNEQRLKELQAIAEPCTPEDTRGPAFVGIKLSDNARRLLTAIAENPTQVMMEFYNTARLANQTGNKAKEQLIRADLIQEEEIPGAGSGKTKSAWLNPDGIQAYRNVTGREPKQLFRTKQAGWAHDWWVNRITGFFYREQGVPFEIAKPLGNQEADVVITANGVRTAFEVTLTLTNVEDKLKMLKHIDRLAYCFINKTQARKVEKDLTIPDELRDRVEFRLLKDFLK